MRPWRREHRGGNRVFRYDNAPHHPEILTFPHHKHLGPEDRLAESTEPNLADVLAEIEGLLTASQ
ncbi:MAG: toxin-antitoxin system TumE family protein [Anaerolineales bacterium]